MLDAGTFAAKAISGQPVAVSSKVYSDGHDRLAVVLNWRPAHSQRWHSVPMQSAGNDLWLAEFTPTELGPHLFGIQAWIDPFATYCHDLEKVPRRRRGQAGAGRGAADARPGHCPVRWRRAQRA